MALAIAATLIGAPVDPRPVQVNVTGLTIGTPFTVTAACVGWSAIVQGGDDVVAVSTQVVLVDIATPLNASVTYTVTHAATSAVSAPLTVACAAEAILQSLDGTTVAAFEWMDNEDPRAQAPRVAFYRPAGAARPIMHYDVAGDESGTILAETTGADTTALRALVAAGAPVLVRTEPGLRDLTPVEVLGIVAAPRRLVGAAGDLRRWDLAYTLVSDEDDTPLVMVTLDHLNQYYATKKLSDVNTQWAGLTLANMNAFDWIGAL